MHTRDLIAARFRKVHGSIASNGTDANVYPYFVGVFDTVAALLNRAMSFLLVILFLVLDAFLSWLLLFLPGFPLIGRFVSCLASPWHNFFGVFCLTFIAALMGYIYTHLKFDFRVSEYDWKQKLRAVHWTELYQKFYDYTLNPNIPYAKHAISIDENRKNFRRVGWDPRDNNRPSRDENGNIFFEQVWFAGNHADIGGGYEENESRLSDTTLQWMLNAATVIPHPIKFDAGVLVIHPASDGRRHDEVKNGLGILTTLTGITWTEEHRRLRSKNTPIHKSVYQRFDVPEAFEFDTWKPYRPETLRTHVDFARYYKPDAPFPASSLDSATAMA